MLRKRDGLIDWLMTSSMIRNRVRGLVPWPTAYTYLGGLQVKILGCEILPGEGLPGTIVDVGKGHLVAAAGKGLLALTEIQPAGRGPMSIRAFLQGHAVHVGMRLSGPTGKG